jgi:hypothetical protein
MGIGLSKGEEYCEEVDVEFKEMNPFFNFKIV